MQLLQGWIQELMSLRYRRYRSSKTPSKVCLHRMPPTWLIEGVGYYMLALPFLQMELLFLSNGIEVFRSSLGKEKKVFLV